MKVQVSSGAVWKSRWAQELCESPGELRSCVKVQVSSGAVWKSRRAQELCESRGGRPGLSVPNSPYGLCGRKATMNLNHCSKELGSCVKVEVAILGSPSLTILMVSVDVKLCFRYSQPPDSSHPTLHCWFLRLFCFRSLYMEWPSPSSPTETSLDSFKYKHFFSQKCRPAMCVCFLFRANVFHPFQVSRAFAAYFSFVWLECLCVCACVCVRACVWLECLCVCVPVCVCVRVYD